MSRVKNKRNENEKWKQSFMFLINYFWLHYNYFLIRNMIKIAKVDVSEEHLKIKHLMALEWNNMNKDEFIVMNNMD